MFNLYTVYDVCTIYDVCNVYNVCTVHAHDVRFTHTFYLFLHAGIVEEVVDSIQLAYYSPKTQGVSNVLSPGSYLAWGITSMYDNNRFFSFTSISQP